MKSLLALFIGHSQIAYQTEQLLYERFFDSIFSLENDETTVL